jgi:hypothetical protein
VTSNKKKRGSSLHGWKRQARTRQSTTPTQTLVRGNKRNSLALVDEGNEDSVGGSKRGRKDDVVVCDEPI